MNRIVVGESSAIHQRESYHKVGQPRFWWFIYLFIFSWLGLARLETNDNERQRNEELPKGSRQCADMQPAIHVFSARIIGVDVTEGRLGLGHDCQYTSNREPLLKRR